MDYFSKFVDKKHLPQSILSILFVIYLVIGFKMPHQVAIIIDSSAGKIVVALAALFLFAYSNPVLGVLGLLVAYSLITSASIKTGMAGLEKFYPSEEKKWSPFSPTHQFDYTLEQEVVKKMASQKFNTSYVKAPYKPVLEDNYGAAPANN